LQIIAGAGSGKTKVLTHRIAYLIEQGVNPYQILALTFTNKAAKEMRERIARILNSEDANKIWAGTFHSIFARILRMEAHQIGYDQSFSIYDVEDSQNALRRVFADNLIPKDTKPNAIFSAISAAKNKLISPEKYSENASTQFEKVVAECYRLYQLYLLQNNAMDFDDLLVNTVRLFQQQEILAKYQDRFHYILVDEYQDTNKVQYITINQLAKHRQNICIVGDDAQSIYRWRGAEIQNILNFEKDYPNCKTVKLEQNYRSTKNILAIADSVISNNQNQLRKNLWTENEAGEKATLMKLSDGKSEAKTIIEIIKQLNLTNPQENKLKQFAILYRTNAQSLEFENACRLAGLHYIVVGSMSFYKRKEIKDILAYLRLLINPKDDNSILRIINEPPRSIGASSVEIFMNYSKQNGIPIVKSLKFAESIFGQKKRSVQAMKLFDLIEKHTNYFNEKAEPEHLIEYIEKTGILDFYREIGTDEANDRILNIEQLLTDIISFLKEDKSRDLQSYLEQVSLVSDMDAKELNEDRLTLMTLHSAKGLEFDNVFIAGMEGNLFPSSSCRSLEDEEEERRLFYVGITRAKKKLFLSYASGRLKFGYPVGNPPSMFLKEIDEELLEDKMGNTFLVKKKSFESISHSLTKKANPLVKKTFPAYSEFNDMPYKENYSQIPEAEIIKNAANKRLKVGDVVKHNSFGVGKIIGLSGNDADLKATINFNEIGRKQLLLKFANLEKFKN
jgi:DNA helicase-2/ATP-dependent DNA helicase PcrA